MKYQKIEIVISGAKAAGVLTQYNVGSGACGPYAVDTVAPAEAVQAGTLTALTETMPVTCAADPSCTGFELILGAVPSGKLFTLSSVQAASSADTLMAETAAGSKCFVKKDCSKMTVAPAAKATLDAACLASCPDGWTSSDPLQTCENPGHTPDESKRGQTEDMTATEFATPELRRQWAITRRETWSKCAYE